MSLGVMTPSDRGVPARTASCSCTRICFDRDTRYLRCSPVFEVTIISRFPARTARTFHKCRGCHHTRYRHQEYHPDCRNEQSKNARSRYRYRSGFTQADRRSPGTSLCLPTRLHQGNRKKEVKTNRMVSASTCPKNNVRKYENLKSILANITFIRIL